MPKKKKNNNPEPDITGAPYIENLIKIIAKSLKENMDSNDIEGMAKIANEFGIDIKLSTSYKDGNEIKLPKKNPAPEQKAGQLPKQPQEPFIETIYKKDSVIVDASIPNAKREEINVIASRGDLIIEISNKAMVYSKKLQLEANVDPEKATATYKNGVLEVVLPIVQMAYQKDFKLSIN